MKSPSILLIEDDPLITDLLELYLERYGFRFSVAHDGAAGLARFYDQIPDLVVLDVMMPGRDGWSVCEEIRSASKVPIIFLTGKGEGYDKLKGFSLGADDYLVKPFDPKELIARIRAVLKRTHPTLYKDSAEFPDLVVDATEYRVLVRGKDAGCAPKEVELLYCLASRPGKVFSREELLQAVWGMDYFGDSNTVDVHIKRIRDRIGEHPAWRIGTVRGVGYRFEAGAS
ncbi:response regulator transcription factor [Paenibacillus pasadenensis]|uniref:Phosphate regulon transcriptional regulatory protein PhoB (SphR) n=1 Tax=Paenibacillus pasadenensis TaxID=217090 RepID=A0A2N5NDQ3_9BACL|nr:MULTISPECIES: response regulator transcription factor [Paenibacillus]PLT48390.1 Phosphate regulon transcriptional regulatory protein PhoB (SphR) [Paenibacillus pasadenensis]QGG58132.1 response regulator [Paenibacillus sp. B01]